MNSFEIASGIWIYEDLSSAILKIIRFIKLLLSSNNRTLEYQHFNFCITGWSKWSVFCTHGRSGYLPIEFLQCPPRQSPGIASHSLISIHFPVCTFFKKPILHESFSGQLSQGWPQAWPMVAQQSCLVQTTPSNWPEHISFSIRLKHGPVLKWVHFQSDYLTK